MTRSTAQAAHDLPGRSSALDEVDHLLLGHLTADARLSTAELARRVNMSAPAVRERVGRLERTGVIRGVRLNVNPAALGLPVAAWVRIRPSVGQLSRLIDLVFSMPEVSECDRTSGEDCLLIKVHLARIEALESVLDRLLPYGQTTSSFVVATPIAPRPPARSAAGSSAAPPVLPTP